MLLLDPPLRCPGLFVTGTDTGVGKTLATCAVAAALRGQRPGARVGVCKPMASGCRRDREGLVSEDAEALAHFADCRLPLDVVCPVRFAPPLSPAAAAEAAGVDTDFDAIADALHRLDAASDVLLVEGVGGLLVPLDAKGKCSVLDLMREVGYPAVIVARSGLGTVNHTALTARVLRDAGLPVAGVVMNFYPTDEAATAAADPSITGNRRWIEKVTGLPVLAMLPLAPAAAAQPERGLIADDILAAAAACDWWSLAQRPVTGGVPPREGGRG